MSNYGIDIYTDSGEIAISKLYSSYRILSSGKATLVKYRVDNTWFSYDIYAVSIYFPGEVDITSDALPMLLLKNTTGNAFVGIRSTSRYNVRYAWSVVGRPNPTTQSLEFEYAIAVSNGQYTGSTETSYGIQSITENNTVVFDSRHSDWLSLVGNGGLSAGYAGDNSTFHIKADWKYSTLLNIPRYQWFKVGTRGIVVVFAQTTLCFCPIADRSIQCYSVVTGYLQSYVDIPPTSYTYIGQFFPTNYLFFV